MSSRPKLPVEHGPAGALRIYAARLGGLALVVAGNALLIGVIVAATVAPASLLVIVPALVAGSWWLSPRVAGSSRLAGTSRRGRGARAVALDQAAGPLLKHRIDAELLRTMQALHAEAASVIIEAPSSGNGTSLVFLSAFGPWAPRIRRAPISRDSIAGRVLASGRPENLRVPSADPGWNPGIDLRAGATTHTLLAVPVVRPDGGGRRTLAVCEFLNKRDRQPFTRQDEALALVTARRIAPDIARFLDDERNYETLGIPLDQPYREASVMLCDLTDLIGPMERMNTSSAILLLDEYLERLGEIALEHGATLVANRGDELLLSFNVPEPLDGHPQRAVDAAWAMRQDAWRISRGWRAGDAVQVDIRIGIAVGHAIPAVVGPRRHRQETILGPAVVLAGFLCRVAPRGQDVIVVDKELVSRVDGYVFESIEIGHEAYEVPSGIYRLVGRR